MSVRHIHARPGEYIAVHRDGHRRHSGGSGGDGSGCLFLIIAFLIWSFWREILVISLVLGIVALIAWLGWTFRTQIGKALCCCGVAIWKGLRFVLSFLAALFVCCGVVIWKGLRFVFTCIWKGITKLYVAIRGWCNRRRRHLAAH